MLTNLPKHNQQVVGHACKLTSPRHSQSNESNTTTQSRGRRQFITKKRYTPHTMIYKPTHTHTHTCRSKATWLIWYNQLCFKSFSLGKWNQTNKQTDWQTNKQKSQYWHTTGHSVFREYWSHICISSPIFPEEMSDFLGKSKIKSFTYQIWF